jgi:hypothetical protein
MSSHTDSKVGYHAAHEVRSVTCATKWLELILSAAIILD